MGIGQRNRTTLVCTNCGKRYQVPSSAAIWAKKRGMKNHFCSKECQFSFHVKENSSNWIKDRSKLKNKDHSIRWSSDAERWRKRVFERDQYTCQICGNKSGKQNPVELNAHHIKRFSEYPRLRFDISNGITLCSRCHKRTFFQERLLAKLFSKQIKQSAAGQLLFKLAASSGKVA